MAKHKTKPKRSKPAVIHDKLEALGTQQPKRVRQARESASLSIVAQCRSYASKLMPLLWDLAENAASNRDRLKAIEIILDRGFGKAPQMVHVVKAMEDSQVDAIAEAIIRKRQQAQVTVNAKEKLEVRSTTDAKQQRKSRRSKP